MDSNATLHSSSRGVSVPHKTYGAFWPSRLLVGFFASGTLSTHPTRTVGASGNSKSTIAEGLKKTGRVLSFMEPAAFECADSESLVVYYSNPRMCRWLLLTSVSIKFSGICSLKQQQAVSSICAMSNLRHLVLFGVESPDQFYAELTRQSRFALTTFGCDNYITDSLLDFLATQPRLCESSIFAKSRKIVKLQSRQRVDPLLSQVVLLSTTAHLLNCPQLDLSSVRRLEYIGDSLHPNDEIVAIHRICELGPHLGTLRFQWDASKIGDFLDVTKFSRIANCAPAIRYLQLLNVDKDCFEEIIVNGLNAKQWTNLECLVWVPTTPWTVETSADTLGSDGRSIVTIPVLKRLPALSDSPDCPPFCNIDHDFRIQSIGRELMDANLAMRRFVIWNWARRRYDMLSRNSHSEGHWSYGVDLDEQEWKTA